MTPHHGTPVAVTGVTCHFRGGLTAPETIALRGVDIAVEAGQVHAVLGPNGAGKTTLLRILLGLQEPNAGTVRIGGHGPDLADRVIQHLVGYVPSGARSFYLRLSGLENLLFFGRLHGLPRPEAMRRARAGLRAVGLEQAARKRVGLYSHGMQRRLALARALLHEPPVLIVDEATHDLDPEGADQIRRLVRDRADGGAAVVWATQRLEEIRGFADRVTVLHEGRVRFVGSVAQLVATTPTQRYLLRLRNGGAPDGHLLHSARQALGQRGTVEGIGEAEHYLLALRDDVVLGDALAALSSSGIQVLACREERSLVEAALLGLTANRAAAGESGS